MPPTATGTPLPPTAAPAESSSGIIVTNDLQLSAPTVAPGDVLTGTVTLQNEGTTTVLLQRVVIAACPSAGANATGVYDNFNNTGPVTLAPGQSLTLIQGRSFTSSDAPDNWFSYVTYQTADGAWHTDPPVLSFVVDTTTPE
jgi:uncharacterized repeat protein (TIGR01451 family)